MCVALAAATGAAATRQQRASDVSVERALGVERIWLYQLPAPDAAVRYEDSIGELSRLASEGKFAKLAVVGKRHEATTYEIAMAWCLAVSPTTFPIPGASRPESAISSARAADIVLAPADLQELA